METAYATGFPQGTISASLPLVSSLREPYLLELTPFGRQEEWEDSPTGWPQSPTMRWFRVRDEYDTEGKQI